MAAIKAVASGNWNNSGTWTGGVLPQAGDTVYSNGNTIIIDSDIGIGKTNNPNANAGQFAMGAYYEITFLGTTNFMLLGAASNTVGTLFIAGGAGSGTGRATAVATLTNLSHASTATLSGGAFEIRTFLYGQSTELRTDLRAGLNSLISVNTQTSITLDGVRLVGGTAAASYGFAYASIGSFLNIKNSIIVGGTATTSHAIILNTGLTVNVENSIINGTTSNGISNSAGSQISVVSSTITGSTAAAIANSSASGTVTVAGSTLIGGTVAAITNTSTTSVVTVSSSVINAGTGAAITNTSTGTLSVTSSDITASTTSAAITSSNVGANVSLSGNFFDHWLGYPAIYASKWRLGISPTLGQHRVALAGTTNSYYTMYGADNGIFGNPIETNVRLGIVYGGGNLTGSCAVPTPDHVTLGVPVSQTTGTSASSSSGIAEAVWNYAARTITGGTTADITAIKAKTDLLNTDRLSQVATTSIVGAIIAQSNS